VTDLELALEHYRLIFPDLASLGEGAPPSAWKAEYDRVASTGLSATLVTQTSSEGQSVQAQKNFSQKSLLTALHERRAELDTNYQPFAPGRIRRALGFRVRL
jgi:hypothetical protein